MRRMFAFLLLTLLFASWPAQAAENVYNQVNEAVKAQSAGDLNRAFTLYTAIIDSGKLRSDPKILAYIHNNRAVIWLQRENEGMALEDFQRALQLYPDHTTYYNRALILAGRGEQELAVADLNKAIAMFPKYANAFALRGQLLLEQGKVAQARSDMQKAETLRLKIRFLGPGEYEAPAQRHELREAPQGVGGGGASGSGRQRMRVE